MKLQTPEELWAERGSFLSISPRKKCLYVPKNWWGDGDKPKIMWSNEEWATWASITLDEPEDYTFGEWFFDRKRNRNNES